MYNLSVSVQLNCICIVLFFFFTPLYLWHMIAESCIQDGCLCLTPGDVDEFLSQNLDAHVPVSEVKKKKKKKKKDGHVDSTDSVDVTDVCTKEELSVKKVRVLSGVFFFVKTLPNAKQFYISLK